MALKRATHTLPPGQIAQADALACRQAWRSGYTNSFEALAVTPGGTAASADLGGSSEYSNEIFED